MTALSTIDVADVFLSALCEDSEATEKLGNAGSTDVTALIFSYILAISSIEGENKCLDSTTAVFTTRSAFMACPDISGRGPERDILHGLRQDIAVKRAASISALGYMHLLGIIVPCDVTEAIQLFMHSVLLGCPFGKLCLAHCFIHGIGVTQSEVSAIILYESLLSKGCAWAQNCLGYCLFHEIGSKVAAQDALWLFQKAAAKGLRVAVENAQYCSERGIELPSTDYVPKRFIRSLSSLESDASNDAAILGLFDGGDY